MTNEAPPGRRRRRAGPVRWALRLLLLLVLLELALQFAAPLYRRLVARDREAAAPDAPLAVLCVGDSHTYGLNVPRLFSYPERLRALLDRRYSASVSVFNRGVPGQNAAQVAAALPADLDDTRPDLVLILAGINDTWNRDAEGGGASARLGRLKLVRLARVLFAGITTAGAFEVRSDEQGRIVVDRGAGARPVNLGAGAVGVRSGPELAASVQAQLRRALELVGDHGARPVLLTYAEFQGDFAIVNAAVRELAAAEGVLLVDLERAFADHFAESGYESLMLNDHHPNARGYAQVAEDVDRALAEAGSVPREASRDHLSDRQQLDPAGVAASLRSEAGGRLILGGPPGWPFQVLIAGQNSTGDGFDAGGHRIPLLEDAVLALSRLEPSFSGRLDAAGAAELRIPVAVRAVAPPEGLEACLVLLSEAGDAPIAAVSPAVTVQL